VYCRPSRGCDGGRQTACWPRACRCRDGHDSQLRDADVLASDRHRGGTYAKSCRAQKTRQVLDKEVLQSGVCLGDQEVSTKPAADYWTTYRHELEQFVNRTKKREGSGWWMDGEGSIEQMKTVDSAYEKQGFRSDVRTRKCKRS
jgi:hypothetical protein